ncbi:MAG: N-acetylglucosamine-6-phosphate deacetylase [Christensenellales bacterium]
MITITDVVPFVGGRFLDKYNVSFDEGKIVAVGNQTLGQTVDGKGAYCVAGYIDIHTHGGWGKDCMEDTPEAIDTIARYHLYTGTTAFCPTTMTASMPDIDKAIDNIRRYVASGTRGSRILGVHMEGPYLAAKSAGAHPPYLLVAPTDDNAQVVWNNADMVSRITLAPNLACSSEFTAKATARGIQVSLGHDDSIDDEIVACVDAGASTVTHLYNCTSRPSRRQNPKKHLGLTEMGLIDDRLICEVIADDRHVPNSLFKMIYKLKGKDNICLVSDSLSVAGMAAGDYYIGSGESKQSIRIEDGVAVLPAQNTYAGSVTAVGKMVQNLVGAGIDVESALDMATRVPARVLGLTDCGDLQADMRADFNLLDGNMDIVATYVDGRQIQREKLKGEI